MASSNTLSVEKCFERLKHHGLKGVSLHKLLLELLPDTTQEATESGRFFMRREDDDLAMLECCLDKLVSKGFARFEGDGVKRRYFICQHMTYSSIRRKEKLSTG